MKLLKTLSTGLLLVCAIAAQGQTFSNLQLHLDKGKYKVNDTEIERNQIRAKVQMLGFDSLGIFYWSADMYYSLEDDASTAAQFKIFRGFKISKKTHLQVIGGHAGIVGRNNYFFAGIHHPLKFGKVLVLPMLLYSYTKTAESADFRFITAFNAKFINNKLTVFGFANVFTADKMMPDGSVDGKRWVAQIRPQIIYGLTKQIAVGTELDLSYHRYTPENKAVFLPGAMMRWTF